MERKYKIALGIALAILLLGAIVYAVSNIMSKQQRDYGPKLPGNICTMEYAPVCGVNGITYGNKCMAQETEIAYEGECNNAAGGTYPAGEVPNNVSNEDLASS